MARTGSAAVDELSLREVEALHPCPEGHHRSVELHLILIQRRLRKRLEVLAAGSLCVDDRIPVRVAIGGLGETMGKASGEAGEGQEGQRSEAPRERRERSADGSSQNAP